MSRTSSQEPDVRCVQCGASLDLSTFGLSTREPVYAEAIPEDERSRRVFATPDTCVIDAEHFFVRGLVEIPVRGTSRTFAYGVWVSLSRQSYERMLERWEAADRASDPPCFGWFSSRLPGYPDTLNLRCGVHSRAPGVVPRIELEPTGHPLAVEQREGISAAALAALASRWHHA